MATGRWYWAVERDCGLLEVKQNAAGALGGDGLGCDGSHDLVERQLDVGQGLHAGKAGAEDVSAADGAGGIAEALLIAVVEVTEPLATEGGRAAGGAVRLGEVADADGHGSLHKSGLIALRYSLLAKSQLSHAAGGLAAKWYSVLRGFAPKVEGPHGSGGSSTYESTQGGETLVIA